MREALELTRRGLGSSRLKLKDNLYKIWNRMASGTYYPPEHVNVHDFVDPGVGRATPYGIYDVALNRGWVSVGKTFDTARFAVYALRQWWFQAGKAF